MSEQNLQLLNIGIGIFKRANNQLTLDMERKLFRYDHINELNKLKHDNPDFSQLTSLTGEDHYAVLTYLLPDKVKNLKALSRGDKTRLNTTEDTKIVAYRYIPVFDVSQASGEPILTAGDFVKDHLTTNHENVTTLYNEFKDYLNKNADLKVSEKPLAGLDGAKGYFRKGTSEIVTGGDEPNSQLKLKTLYHEFTHGQLYGLNAEYNDRPRPYGEAQAEAVAYVVMQNIGIDTGEYSLGYIAAWAKDKEIIHNALNEIQSVNKKVIDITDEPTQKLSLQEGQKESDNLKTETKQETTSENKRSANNNNRSSSDHVQAQLNGFVEQNPSTKKPEQEQTRESRM